MRFYFISTICVSGSMLSGCGNGGEGGRHTQVSPDVVSTASELMNPS